MCAKIKDSIIDSEPKGFSDYENNKLDREYVFPLVSNKEWEELKYQKLQEEADQRDGN